MKANIKKKPEVSIFFCLFCPYPFQYFSHASDPSFILYCSPSSACTTQLSHETDNIFKNKGAL